VDTRPADRPSADAVAEAVDHVAVTRLQHAYADAVNRRDWDAVAALFLPEAHVHLDLVDRPAIDLDGAAAVVEFLAPAVERFSSFVFAILASHVELWPDGDRDRAEARLYLCELRTSPGEDGDGPGEETRAFGLYRDRYVRTEAGWRIAARRYRTMARSPGGVAFPLPTPDEP
jgi:ketosteroid isomerase-like protein